MAYRPLASSFAEGIGSNEFHTASGDVCPVAINVFPAGSIPACRPVTYTKMIICSIDPSLVSELSAESDLAVTLIQRFGSAANLNIHLHCRVLDSIWRAGSQMGGVLRRHSPPAPQACRSEPLFSRTQVLVPARPTEPLFHRSRQTERTLRTPSRDAWREESETG
jgi:hypothetical protein